MKIKPIIILYYILLYMFAVNYLLGSAIVKFEKWVKDGKFLYT